MRKPDSHAPAGARPSLTPFLTPAPTPDPSPPPSSSKLSSTSNPDPDPEDSESSTSILRSKPLQSVVPRNVTRAGSSSSKAKHSRKSQLEDSSEGVAGDDDGDDADAEFSDFKSNWVNTSTRRKSTASSYALEMVKPIHRVHQEDDDVRRHSLAI